MNLRIARVICVGLACLAGLSHASAKDPNAPRRGDSNIQAARKLVESSDRYLHHSKLKRGMKGYGLTVLAGTKIEKFDVEIVSVMGQWGPSQDVILAKIASDEFDFQKSGIIAGMSGSPAYIRDPEDGKYKMIGAVAYGWSLSNEPLCGIQPITQMLGVAGVLSDAKSKLGDDKDDKENKVTSSPRRRTRTSALGRWRGRKGSREAYLKAVLNPERTRTKKLAIRLRDARSDQQDTQPRMRPLAAPLMISGVTRESFGRLSKSFRSAGLMPVQAGKVGGAEADEVKGLKLEPGSAVAIPLVSGDLDWYAVGTVTEVIDDRVLAFGHSFDGEGEIEYPMATAYVHTVVSSIMRSFKLASTVDVVGRADRDEYVAVGGKVGKSPAMIPLEIIVRHNEDDRARKQKYNIVKHWWYAPMLAESVVYQSVYAFRSLPENHIVRYEVEVDYGEFGKVRTSNVQCDEGLWGLANDLYRPLTAFSYNWYAKPRYPEKISVNVSIEKGENSVYLAKLDLDGETYKPGQTVTGKLTCERFRKDRKTIDVKFKLPKDIREGSYTLVASDPVEYIWAEQDYQPQKYAVKTEKDLLKSIQRVMEPKGNELYLYVPLGKASTTIHRQKLPDLPSTRASMIGQANLLDESYAQSVVVEAVKTDHTIYGSAAASFTVSKNPRKRSVRE